MGPKKESETVLVSFPLATVFSHLLFVCRICTEREVSASLSIVILLLLFHTQLTVSYVGDALHDRHVMMLLLCYYFLQEEVQSNGSACSTVSATLSHQVDQPKDQALLRCNRYYLG